MIKPFDNGGLYIVVYSVTHKILMSDTTSRSFIPPQAHKMIPKLHQIFGCEFCIIPKDVRIYLNRFITKLVTCLQKKSVDRHTHNILFITTSDAHYKVIVFPYGECLHATIKGADKCITCIEIKPNNIIHIKFDLGFVKYVLSKVFPVKN